MSFTIAESIDDAIAAMADGARPIAGGSDLVVGARHGAHPLPEKLVAIDRVPELGVSEQTPHGYRIGASVRHAELMQDAHVVQHYSAIADAAALVGSPATRNVGTIGGNVMNGSPAMDTGAPLLVLGASVELRSTDEVREVDVGDLWRGPGSTTAAADELCTAILLPLPAERSGSAYVRLEYRRAMEIAVVGAAAAVQLDSDGVIVAATIALTAVAPTIVAVKDLDLVGRLPSRELQAEVATAASAAAQPISDLRASDDYRRHAVGVMAKRAFDAAARRAAGENIAVPVNRSLGIGAARD